jgi:hypothetical protein
VTGDEVPLTPIDRDVVTGAIAGVEALWERHRTEQYTNGVARRDALFTAWNSQLTRLTADAADMTSRVKAGRVSPSEARTWTRDGFATHTRLAAQRDGLVASDADLAAMDATSTDAYQDQQLDRMPLLAQSAPTLADEMRRYHTEHVDELSARLASARQAARPRYPVVGPAGIDASQLREQP